jgi:hypothetical protein
MRTTGFVLTSVGTALLVALGSVGFPSSARAAQAHPAAIAMARAYFSDLGAHRYLAAARLEATCNVVLSSPVPGTSVVSSAGLRGRSANVAQEARRLGFLRADQITSARQYTTPLLARYHIVGVDVGGRYTFRWPSGGRGAVNFGAEYPSGYYHIRVLVRRCGNTAEVDPGWVEGSPASETGGICKKECNVICGQTGCRKIYAG